MTVRFSKDAKEFLLNTQNFIAKDKPITAKKYITKLINRIVDMLQFPDIGKVNAVFDDDSIREITLDGIKIIYKKSANSVTVLMVYRYIDFNESQMDTE